MKRRSSFCSAFSPVSRVSQESRRRSPASAALAAWSTAVKAVSMPLASRPPCAAPCAARSSASNTPRRLGSAASVPINGCAWMIWSAKSCTFCLERNSRPFCLKKLPPSGRRTLLNRSVSPASRADSAVAASSASSGVRASTSTASRSTFCGNAFSSFCCCSRHGRFELISLPTSVSMLMRDIVNSAPAAANPSTIAVNMAACRRLIWINRASAASIVASRLAIEQQEDADKDERHRPDPRCDAAARLVEPELEPARPAGGDAAQRQRHMRDLDEQLLLDVGQRVRMGQQQDAAERGDEREKQRRPRAAPGAGAHPPFEESEGGDERHEDAMLHHFRVAQAGEEADIAQRPDLGIGADEEEGGESGEEQRPMAHPGHMAGALGQRQQADGEDEQAGPMVVVLRPGDVLGIARRQHALDGDESLRRGRV